MPLSLVAGYHLDTPFGHFDSPEHAIGSPSQSRECLLKELATAPRTPQPAARDEGLQDQKQALSGGCQEEACGLRPNESAVSCSHSDTMWDEQMQADLEEQVQAELDESVRAAAHEAINLHMAEQQVPTYVAEADSLWSAARRKRARCTSPNLGTSPAQEHSSRTRSSPRSPLSPRQAQRHVVARRGDRSL